MSKVSLYHGARKPFAQEADFLAGRPSLEYLGSGNSMKGTGPLHGPGFYLSDARPVAKSYASVFANAKNAIGYDDVAPVIYEYKLPKATLLRTMQSEDGQIPHSSASLALRELQNALHMTGEDAVAFDTPFGISGVSGREALGKLYARLGSMKDVTNALSDVGIIGTRYKQRDVAKLREPAAIPRGLIEKLPEERRRYAGDIFGGNNYAIWDQPTLDELAHSAKMEYYRNPLA